MRGLRVSINLGPVLSLVAITGLAVAIALEVGTRVFLGSVFYPRPPLYVYDENLLYKLRPSLEEVYVAPDFQMKITTAKQGHRICADAESIASDGLIVAMGDSYTMGWGVDDNESWPCVLGEHVNRESNLVLSVVNTGVNGYGTWQYRRLTESIVLGNTTKVVAIVIMLCSNDPADNVRFEALSARSEEEVMGMVPSTVLGAEDMQPISRAKFWLRNNSYAYWMLSRTGFLGSVRKAITADNHGNDRSLDEHYSCAIEDCSIPLDELVADIEYIVSVAAAKSIPVFVVSANRNFLDNELDGVCPQVFAFDSTFTDCTFINIHDTEWSSEMVNRHSGGHFSALGHEFVGVQIARYVLSRIGE